MYFPLNQNETLIQNNYSAPKTSLHELLYLTRASFNILFLWQITRHDVQRKLSAFYRDKLFQLI